jgi:phage FluMu protein Com
MITLNCKLCNDKMSSIYFEADDVITCPKCWEQ